MHVLLVVNELSYFQAHRRILMEDLVERGVRVSVAVGASTPDVLPVKPANWPASIGFHPYRIDRHRLNIPLDVQIIRHIRRVCGDIAPDVVHAITIKPVLFCALALAFWSSAARPAVVLTLPGLGKIFEPAQGASKRIRQELVTRALKIAAARTRAVVTTENPQDRDRLVTLGIVLQKRAIAVAGAGLDLEVFHGKKRPKTTGPLRVLMASRLIETKGVGIYLEAAKRLSQADIPMQFALAGPIDRTDADVIDERVLETARAEGTMTYLGSVDPDDMAKTLRAYDIVCLPTLLREGFPRALLEAVACGCIPVASDQPAIRQLVVDGETGLLLDPVDADALETAFRRLAGSADLRARLQRNATAHLHTMAIGRQDVCDTFLAAYDLAGLNAADEQTA